MDSKFSYLNYPDDPRANFVYSSWLQSFKKSHFAGVVSDQDYYDSTRRTIDKLFRRGAKCLFICDPTDEDNVAGYVVFERCSDSRVCSPVVIHYLYVKQRFRRKGIANALVDQAVGKDWDKVDYTFKTDKSHLFGRRFNYRPSLARREKLV